MLLTLHIISLELKFYFHTPHINIGNGSKIFCYAHRISYLIKSSTKYILFNELLFQLCN